ncbi:plastocyanin/azurin family copper-binding protein [Profundibacter sp.]|uniref:plastocyanin/azurin family copper-binding protein n=1 Tax=Profundibacter sp. TaxID=3101071 RepID=UPI003D0D1861
MLCRGLFDVINASTDSEHEMVVTKLSGPDGTLPYDTDAMRVDEEAAGSKGEVSELPAGEKGALTVTLEPGTYVLYCNIAGHYAAGMWTEITVK